MFLEFSHTKLDLFQVSKMFALNCYKQTLSFPKEEKFGLITQIRRAALSVHLNIAEGCSRRSTPDRKRFYIIAWSSLIEVDTAFDIAVDLNYTNNEKLTELGSLIQRCFQMLSKMIG